MTKPLPLLAASTLLAFSASFLPSTLSTSPGHSQVHAASLATAPLVTPVSRSDYGIDVFSYDSQMNDPSTIPALNTLDMGMQQFPNANEWSWTTNSFRSGGTAPVSLDDWGSILQNTNNEGLFIFDYDENPSFTGGGTPADATALTEYIMQHHLPISAIVIGSEEYGAWDYPANMNPSYAASYYAEQSALIAQAIHTVDPAMKVGVSFALSDGPHSTNWNQTVLRDDGPYINFVSVHDYPNADLLSNSGLLSAIPGEIQSAMSLIRSDITANVAPQYASNIQTWITEYNPYGEPGPQSLQTVYGAAMVESAMLWKAYGANKLFIWSYDGGAHVANTVASANWPVATNASQPFGLFALVGDGMSPELPANQFYPSGLSLSAYMQAIGSGGTLSTWVTPSVILGQVSTQSGADWFLINESNTPQTVSLNSQTLTIAAASMQEITGVTPISQTSIVPEATAATAPVQYQVHVPQFALAKTAVYAGEQVTLSGSSFANQGPLSRIILMQNGVHYGAPGDDYTVPITSWSPTSIQFTMPDGAGGPALSIGNATVQVETNNNVISAKANVTVGSVPTLPISGVNPSTASPGQHVTVSGEGFGASQGTGYVLVSQNGVNYGGPGDSYKISISQWTNRNISLTIPNGASGPALASGAATLKVVNSQGLQSAPETVQITPAGSSPSPVPTPIATPNPAPAVSPISPYPGETVTLTGSHFGSSQNPGYVMVSQNGINYGGPGDTYSVTTTHWQNGSITFVLPNGTSGPALVPGTATLRVANSSGKVVDTQEITVQSAPLLPISLSPATPFSPGQWVTVTGEGFGSSQGTGYVQISQDGVNYGAPGDSYPVSVQNWSHSQITFLVPTNAFAVNGLWERSLAANQDATVTVVSASGVKSRTVTSLVVSP